MRVTVDGPLPAGVAAKDLALALVGQFGVRVGVGYAIEFAGSGVEALDMAGRLTLCNMAVEAGARSGLVAPDDVTFDWLRGRPMAPSDAHWDAAVAYWRTLPSDAGARVRHGVALQRHRSATAGDVGDVTGPGRWCRWSRA